MKLDWVLRWVRGHSAQHPAPNLCRARLRLARRRGDTVGVQGERGERSCTQWHSRGNVPQTWVRRNPWISFCLLVDCYKRMATCGEKTDSPLPQETKWWSRILRLSPLFESNNHFLANKLPVWCVNGSADGVVGWGIIRRGVNLLREPVWNPLGGGG